MADYSKTYEKSASANQIEIIESSLWYNRRC
jgi:hypothetical protein